MNIFTQSYKNTALLVTTAITLSACTTVLGGSQQEVEFEVRGADSARCFVSNKDFKYIVDAPTKIYFERSPKDLTANCIGKNQRNVSLTIPATSGWPHTPLVNVADGTLPGFETDPINSPFYKYPDHVIVDFDVRDGYTAGVVSEDMIQPSAEQVDTIWPKRYTAPNPSAVQEVEQMPEDAGEPDTTSRTEIEVLHDQYNNPVSKRNMPVIEQNTFNANSSATSEPMPMASSKMSANIQNVQMQPIIEVPAKNNNAVKLETTSKQTIINTPTAPAKIEVEKPIIPNVENSYSDDLERSDLIQPSPISTANEFIETENKSDVIDGLIMEEIESDISRDLFEEQSTEMPANLDSFDTNNENSNSSAFE